MSEKLVAEAAKQLRNVLGLFVTISLIWIMTAEAVKGTLLQRERAKHLAAWLLIRDTFASVAPSLVELTTSGPIACVTKIVQIQSGTEVESCPPFQMRIPWLGIDTFPVQLEHIAASTSAYRVVAPIDDFPLNLYALVTIGGVASPVPLAFTKTERDVHNAVLRDGLAAPAEWGAVRVHLYSRGWKGTDPKDLQLNDVAVASFIRDGQSSSYAVSGIPFSAGSYPAAVSTFLCLLAFLLVGPWLVLRLSVRPPAEDPWVMLSPGKGVVGYGLAGLQVAVSVFIVLLPSAVMLTQWELIKHMNRREAMLVLPTWLGLALATVLLAAVGFSLGRLRWARQTPTSIAGPAAQEP